jgi:hypothetical protein
MLEMEFSCSDYFFHEVDSSPTISIWNPLHNFWVTHSNFIGNSYNPERKISDNSILVDAVVEYS